MMLFCSLSEDILSQIRETGRNEGHFSHRLTNHLLQSDSMSRGGGRRGVGRRGVEAEGGKGEGGIGFCSRGDVKFKKKVLIF